MDNVTNYYSAVIFDLDNTLVLTDSLKTLRAERRWKQILRSFDRTTIPPGTLEFLNEIRSSLKIPIGVVTRSPRHYAEGILRHHAINVDVLVAYHDVSLRKPNPQAVFLAAQKLGTESKYCIYIGDPDGGVDRLTASNSGSKYIEINWATPGANWDEVEVELRLLMKRSLSP